MSSRLSAEQRSSQLVREAMGAFGSRGFEGTSLEAVAEAAGVRKQTLLYYFPSKEDLFEACVNELVLRLRNTLESVLSGPEEGWGRIEAIIRGIFRMAADWPEIPPFVREAARRSPELVSRVAGELEPLRKRALLFLENGMDEGKFRHQDPGLLLFTMYTAIIGSMTEAGVLRAIAGGAGGRTALRRREEELIEFVRRALEP